MLIGVDIEVKFENETFLAWNKIYVGVGTAT